MARLADTVVTQVVRAATRSQSPSAFTHLLETEPSTADDHRRKHALVVAHLCYCGFRAHIADEAASNALTEAWPKDIRGDQRSACLFTMAKRMASR
ncbi:hypothetical protein ALI144C_00055 [Actinosynnema sp. ALI-1.44]|nr:hypothetical protein ALI144C_00055 [Actinosynnema sp. ALI-1.44]